MSRPTNWTRRRWTPSIVALLTLALGACSDGDAGGGERATTSTQRPTTTLAPADEEPGESALELTGTSWRLVALVDGDGERAEATGEVPAVISFDEDEVEGYDGVDTATGTYELRDDELTVELAEVSELGPPSDPGIEQLLFELLVQVDRAEVDDGELVLHHDGGELRLEPAGGGTAD